MDARITDYAVADAKAHFSELLARAEAGEEITIRRHGKAVARLSGVASKPTPEDRVKAYRDWIAYRTAHGIALGPDLTVKQLIEQGRK